MLSFIIFIIIIVVIIIGNINWRKWMPFKDWGELKNYLFI